MKLFTIEGRELTDEEAKWVFTENDSKFICPDTDRWYAHEEVYTADELPAARQKDAPSTNGAGAEHPTFFERLAEALKEEGCKNWNYFLNADDERE